jgi:hypothetical protein
MYWRYLPLLWAMGADGDGGEETRLLVQAHTLLLWEWPEISARNLLLFL